MKAILVRAFGGPEVMTLEDVSDPVPGPGQVRVRVEAAGINPVDTYIRTGTHALKPPLPYTPGMDLSGTIDMVGADVTGWTIGDRVYSDGSPTCSGAYAAMAVCDARHIHRLPARTSCAQGAALGVPYATAWFGLHIRARAEAGETVLVHGASGGVGTAAVQIAKAHGLRVIGTAGTSEGVALVGAQGAHLVLNHRDAGYTEAIARETGGRGVDVILEMLANVNLDRDLELIAKGGRVVVIGNRGRVEIDPRKAMGKNASILGLMVFNATPAELTRIHAALFAGLENGSLQPVIGRQMPLAAAADAHVAVMQPGAMGKIVLIP